MKAVLLLRDRECLLFVSSDNSTSVGSAATGRAEAEVEDDPLRRARRIAHYMRRSRAAEGGERGGGKKVTQSERGLWNWSI